MSFSTRCMKAEDWAEIRYFKITDFNRPDNIGYEFMIWIDNLRHKLGLKIYPSSDSRTPESNEAAGGASKSAHLDPICDAMDFSGIRMTASTRYALVALAIQEGCERIGVYANGSVHLDRTEDIRPSPVLWTKV